MSYILCHTFFKLHVPQSVNACSAVDGDMVVFPHQLDAFPTFLRIGRYIFPRVQRDGCMMHAVTDTCTESIPSKTVH
jgi:hypothetical protein